jgi:hypothetical protein
MTFGCKNQFRICSRGEAIVSCLLVAVLLTGGCGQAKRDILSARIVGTVTYSGKPIRDGEITFAPTAAGQGPTVAARIATGKYEAPAVPLGKVLVRIHATELSGRKVTVDGMVTEELIRIGDDRFRTGVELLVEGDRNDQDFELVVKD